MAACGPRWAAMALGWVKAAPEECIINMNIKHTNQGKENYGCN